MILLGYMDGIKGYRLYDLNTGKVSYKRNVVFNENEVGMLPLLETDKIRPVVFDLSQTEDDDNEDHSSRNLEEEESTEDEEEIPESTKDEEEIPVSTEDAEIVIQNESESRRSRRIQTGMKTIMSIGLIKSKSQIPTLRL